MKTELRVAPSRRFCAILIAGAVFGQDAAQKRIVEQVTSLIGPQGAEGIASLLAQQPFPGQSGNIATLVSLVTLALGAIGFIVGRFLEGDLELGDFFRSRDSRRR